MFSSFLYFKNQAFTCILRLTFVFPQIILSLIQFKNELKIASYLPHTLGLVLLSQLKAPVPAIKLPQQKLIIQINNIIFNYFLYFVTKTNQLSLLINILLISCYFHFLYFSSNTHFICLEQSNRYLTGLCLQMSSVPVFPRYTNQGDKFANPVPSMRTNLGWLFLRNRQFRSLSFFFHFAV